MMVATHILRISLLELLRIWWSYQTRILVRLNILSWPCTNTLLEWLISTCLMVLMNRYTWLKAGPLVAIRGSIRIKLLAL